ncbi:MAG TPA: hypothetical protein VM925_20140 [Labilithrix sp.]|nr:hypothetical protein [Labilithrix sp.]
MCTLSGVVACSFVVGYDREQCITNTDCLNRGLSARAICVDQVCTEPPVTPPTDAAKVEVDAPPEDPVWGCLGRVPPLPNVERTVPVHFVAQFQTLAGDPLAGLSVKVCNQLDVQCAAPHEGTPQLTNSEGLLDVTVYSGYRGYLDVETELDGGAFSTFMPSVSYIQPIPDKAKPPPGDAGARFPTRLLTKEEVKYYAVVAGEEAKDEYGHLLYTAFDCQGNLAADVVLKAETVTADSAIFYIDEEGNPSLTQGKTGRSGAGGYLNLPSGSVGMTLSRSNGARIAQQNVIMRPGTITYTLFEPSP